MNMLIILDIFLASRVYASDLENRMKKIVVRLFRFIMLLASVEMILVILLKSSLVTEILACNFSMSATKGLYFSILVLIAVSFKIVNSSYVNSDNKYLLFLILITINIGFWGYVKSHEENINLMNLVNSFYFTLQLFGLSLNKSNGVNLLIYIASFLASLSLCGLVLIVLAVSFLERLKLTFLYRKSVVIFSDGIDDVVFNLVQSENAKKIVLLTNETGRKFDSNVLLLSYSNSEFLISKINSLKIKKIFLFRDDDQKNIEMSYNIFNNCSTYKNRSETLHIIVYLKNSKLTSLIVRDPIFNYCKSKIDIQVIDYYDELALRIVHSNLPDKLLLHENTRSNDIVVVNKIKIGIKGKGALYHSMIVQLISQYNYSNFKECTFILIDQVEKDIPEIINVLSRIVKIEFIDSTNSEKWMGINLLYVIYDYDYECYNEYLYIQQKKFDLHINKILLISLFGNRVQQIFESYDYLKYKIIKSSGVELCERDYDKYAKMINSIYYNLYYPKEETITELLWDELPESQRKSSRLAALHLDTLYRYKTTYQTLFSSKTLYEHLAIKEHNRWMVQKVINGFEYDDETNNERNTNRLIKKWSDLDYVEQKRNIHFIKTIIEELEVHDERIDNDV